MREWQVTMKGSQEVVVSPFPNFLLPSSSSVLQIIPLCTLPSFRGSWIFPPTRSNPPPSKHPLLSSCPCSLPSGSSTWGEGGKEKGKEPGLGLPWLPKGFGQFKLEGTAQWAELGVVFILWPNNLEAASLSLTTREVSHHMYRVLGSYSSLADAWEKHHCVLSLFLRPPLGKCRRPLQETGSPLNKPLGLTWNSLSYIWQPRYDFSSPGKPCRQGKQAVDHSSHTSPPPSPPPVQILRTEFWKF